jgi:hypothetical protein
MSQLCRLSSRLGNRPKGRLLAGCGRQITSGQEHFERPLPSISSDAFPASLVAPIRHCAISTALSRKTKRPKASEALGRFLPRSLWIRGDRLNGGSVVECPLDSCR